MAAAIDALERSYEEIQRLDMFVQLAHKSFRNTCHSGRLIRSVKKAIHRLRQLRGEEHNIDYDADEKSVVAMEQLADSCKEMFDDGLPHLYQMATVSLWAILEASVDDLCASYVTENDRWKQVEALRELKGPLLEFASAPPSARGEMLVELLKVQVRAPLKSGVGRFEEVLDAIGLGGPVTDEVRRFLLETVETRNVLVHRGGIADRRFVQACPWVRLSVGGKTQN